MASPFDTRFGHTFLAQTQQIWSAAGDREEQAHKYYEGSPKHTHTCTHMRAHTHTHDTTQHTKLYIHPLTGFDAVTLAKSLCYTLAY